MARAASAAARMAAMQRGPRCRAIIATCGAAIKGMRQGYAPKRRFRVHGVIEVYDSGVRLEVTLPWLLARFAHAVQRVVGQKGTLMFEKKFCSLAL